jgi:hypothetical protein
LTLKKTSILYNKLNSDFNNVFKYPDPILRYEIADISKLQAVKENKNKSGVYR